MDVKVRQFDLTKEALIKLGVDPVKIAACGGGFEGLSFGWSPENGGQMFFELAFPGDDDTPVEAIEHRALAIIKELDRIFKAARSMDLLSAGKSPQLTVGGRKLELPKHWIE